SEAAHRSAIRSPADTRTRTSALRWLAGGVSPSHRVNLQEVTMGPIIRITARVLAGFLIGAGYMSESTVSAIFSDPAMDMAIGAVLWGVTETFYWLAKRYA